MAEQRKRLRAIEPESAPALTVADSGRTTRMTARDELQQWVCGDCGEPCDDEGMTLGRCAANGGPIDPCVSCYACTCDGSC